MKYNQGLNSVGAGIPHVSLDVPHPTCRLPHVQLQLPYGFTSMFRSWQLQYCCRNVWLSDISHSLNVKLKKQCVLELHKAFDSLNVKLKKQCVLELHKAFDI